MAVKAQRVDNRATLDATMSESAYALLIEGLLRMGGWEWFHPYTGQRADTILDYIAWRERVIWIEIKKVGGRLTRDRIVGGHFVKGQVEVIDELSKAGQEIYVWWPKDFEYAKWVLVDAPRRCTIHQAKEERP
jgi:hypothetical protein